jgi:hypothetical protein
MSDTTKFYVKIGLNASSYKGDLQSKYGASHAGLYVGLHFNRKKRLNGALDLIIGNVSGQNPNYSYPTSKNNAIPNSFFKSNYIIITYSLHLNLIKTRHIQTSVHAGLGIIRFQPKDFDNNKLQDQSNSRNTSESYSNIAFTFPIGLNGMYKISNGLALGLDLTWQKLTTDYLDNISELSYSTKKDKMFQANLILYIPIKE